MNTDEGLSQFNFLMPPPATKQYECWTHDTNWDLEPVLKFIPPWPYHEVDMLSRVIATNLPARPYKTLRPFNIRVNLASRVMIQMSFPFPSTKQYVEQIKTIHLESFLTVTTPRPYTAVR